MAVISELIDAGLSLKEQGNHQAAIEHFRQLNATYPNHARIMFELAGSWQAFGVPEQALPLYRQLMALPKSQGLPPKDMPRLYTQMGATLRLLGQFTESLEIIEEGLILFPDYRPLLAYHMFALHSAGFHQNAMIEAFELMLKSLAPTKWDLYEDEIIAIVDEIRDRIPPPDTSDLEDWVFDEFWTEEGKKVKPEADADDAEDASVDEILEEASIIVDAEDDDVEDEPGSDSDEESQPETAVSGDKIVIEDADETGDEDPFEIQVKVINKSDTTKKKPKTSRKDEGDQLGKKPVKIDINHSDDDDEEDGEPDDTVTAEQDTESPSDDDKPSPPTGKINIPIDFD